MSRIFLLFVASTVLAASNAPIYYDTYDHKVKKPATSIGSVCDLDFTGLSICGISGSGLGDFSTNTNTSVVGEAVIFADTTGKLGKRSTGTGIVELDNGVLGTVTIGTGLHYTSSTHTLSVNTPTPTATATSTATPTPTATATPTSTPVVGLDDINILAYRALGSALVAQTLGANATQARTAQLVLVDQTLYLACVYLTSAHTITGVKWLQNLAGNYTANNNNRIGLYSYSGGTLTLVASCANDGNLWKGGSTDTYQSKAFSSTYDAAAGVYFVGILYCRSAVSNAPAIGAFPQNVTTNATAAYTMDFTNSAKLFGLISSQTDLPSTQAMSGVDNLADTVVMVPWVGLY